jgi:hypothetical protein
VKAPPPPDDAVLGTYVYPGYPAFQVKPLAEDAKLRWYLPTIQACTGQDPYLDKRDYHATSPSVFVVDVLFTCVLDDERVRRTGSRCR